MSDCMTKPLMDEYSGCLVENPACKYAVRFGFSYLCEHPQHKEFYLNNSRSKQHLGQNEIYEELREKRRKEYIAKARKYLDDLEFEAF